MMAQTDKAEMEEGMALWRTWMDKHAGDLVDPGMALGKTIRVSKLGVAGAQNDMGGYSVVRAETHEDAARVMVDSPHLEVPGAWIDVTECVPMEPSAT